MATWNAFETDAPGLAALVRDRMESTGLLMLGTIRGNGWPRISPCEYLIVDGELYMGMMWRSQKALDLLRNPRCVLHSTTTSKDGDEGDAKVYAWAWDERDPDRRAAARQASIDVMDFDPEAGGDYHLFRIDVRQVGWTQFTDGRVAFKTWRPPN